MLLLFHNSIRAKQSIIGAYQRSCFSTKKLSEEIFKNKIKDREMMEEKQKPEWQKRNDSIAKRYGQWNPTRKLSRQQISDLKSLKEQVPHLKTIDLANHFKVSPEAVRRILKSKWVPNDEEEIIMKRRGENRKLQAEERKKNYATEINTARSRLNYGKSVNLGEISYSRSSSPSTKTTTKTTWTSNKSKNNNSLHRRIRRPYVESVGDIID